MKNPITILLIALIQLMILYGCNKDPEASDNVKDVEGASYGIIKIGNQVWMTQKSSCRILQGRFRHPVKPVCKL